MGIRICERCARVVHQEKSQFCAKCAKVMGRRENYSSAWERVSVRIIEYANAETMQDARRAREALRHAARKWLKQGTG